MIAALLASLALAGPAEPPPAPPAGATREELRAYRPATHRLPARPETLADFSAHTLEPGEVRIGLGTATVGLAPRLHVGTAPVADALGVANVFAKWHVARLGPLDLGVSGAIGVFPRREGAFALMYGSGAGHLSVRLAPAWSVHATVRYHHLDASGIPKPPAILGAFGIGVDGDALQALQDVEAPSVSARGLTVQVATDVRFNRRDALAIRARQLLRVDAEADLGGWALEGTDGVVTVWDKPATLADPWMVTVAWQFSWRAAQLRVGAGTTSEPALPIVPVLDLSFALGGATRRDAAERWSAWRVARREASRP